MRLKLDFVRPEHLHLHEKPVPGRLKAFKPVYWDPIVVNEKNVVLDGTHRYLLLKRHGVHWIPVLRMRYGDVKIRRWFRIIRGGEFDIDIPHYEKDGGIWIERERGWRVYEIYWKIREFEKNLRIKYWHKPILKFIAPPRIKRSEVNMVALSGKVFPPKATRHIFPYRVLGIDVKLEWLFGTKEEVERRVMEHLERREMIKLKGLKMSSGLKYEEKIYLFADPKEYVQRY